MKWGDPTTCVCVFPIDVSSKIRPPRTVGLLHTSTPHLLVVCRSVLLHVPNAAPVSFARRRFRNMFYHPRSFPILKIMLTLLSVTVNSRSRRVYHRRHFNSSVPVAFPKTCIFYETACSPWPNTRSNSIQHICICCSSMIIVWSLEIWIMCVRSSANYVFEFPRPFFASSSSFLLGRLPVL